MFNAMDPEKKTKLSSGAVVEDIIFAYACGLEKRAPEHSFIIDSENLSLKRLFGADWAEIVTRLDSRREVLRNFLTPQSLEWIPDDVSTVAFIFFNASSHFTKTGNDYRPASEGPLWS